MERRPHRRGRHRPRARGPRDLRRLQRTREPPGRRPSPRPERGRLAARGGVGAVSDATRAPGPTSRHAVRRRAADARHRAGADESAGALAAGRAVARPGAAAHARDLSRGRAHQRRRRDGAAGGTECAPGAAARDARLRAGTGPGGAGGAEPRSRERRPHPRRLSRIGRDEVTMTAPMWEPELESLARERLIALQLERARASLERVLRRPAWAKRLGGVRAADIRSLDDWARLRFLTKDELRDAYPLGLAAGAEYRRCNMPSGTTGNPIVNPYTAADVAQWGQVMARCYVAAGVTRDDVIHITPSFGLFTGGFGFHYGAERLGAMVLPVGAGRTSLQLKLMRDLRATVLTAIATYPLRLLEVARDEGFDLSTLALRVGIFGSEMWSDELRARIERELGIRTFDIIGMTETGGPA